MKKISEMSLDELRDHALLLESEKASLFSDLEAAKTENAEMRETNLLLQKRNNELFMRVEQSATVPVTTSADPEEKEESESLEDFAKNNYKEIMKK